MLKTLNVKNKMKNNGKLCNKLPKKFQKTGQYLYKIWLIINFEKNLREFFEKKSSFELIYVFTSIKVGSKDFC